MSEEKNNEEFRRLLQEEREQHKREIETIKAKKKTNSATKTILSVAFLGIVLIGAMVAWHYLKPDPKPDPHPLVITEERLIAIQEIASEKFEYTAYKTFEQSRKLIEWDIPFTERSFILIYSGEIKAYFDMSKAKITASSDKMTITLPQIKVAHHVDGDAITVRRNILYPFELEDKVELEDDLMIVEENRAIQQGFVEEARKNVDTMLHGMYDGLLPEGQTLEVVQSDEALQADAEYVENTARKAKKIEKELGFKDK